MSSNKVKLNPRPLDAEGQAKLMGRMVADPIMILREHTVNGIEAIERNTAVLKAQGIEADDGLLAPTCEIDIGRDKTYPQKVVIANVGGDFITPTIAENNLCSLGQSGNSEISFFKNQQKDGNIGVGAKIATLGLFPTIIYRSKEAGVSGGMKSSLTLIDGELDATADVCPQEEFSVLQEKDSGTEVLFWGKNKKQDTWDELNRVYISTRSHAVRARVGQTGNALRKWLGNRFAGRFLDAWGREITIRVRDYTLGTKTQVGGKGISIMYVREVLEDPKRKAADSTSIVWDTNLKAKLRSVVLEKDDSNQKISNFKTTGGVSLIYKNEVYSERMISDHKAADALLTKCGLGMLPGEMKNKVWLTVEFPDDAPFIPSLDRTKLIDETGSPVEFETVAEKISQSLGKMKKLSKWIKKNVAVTDKSLEEQAREAFQNQVKEMADLITGGRGGRSTKGKGPGKGKGGGKPGTKGPLGRGGSLGSFEVEIVPNKTAPHIELQVRSFNGKSTFSLTYNSLHKQHLGNSKILKEMIESDPEVPANAFRSPKVREALENAIALKVFVSAFAIVLERKAFIKETNKDLLKALTPERLQTAVDIQDKKLIIKKVKDFTLNWSAVKELEAA